MKNITDKIYEGFYKNVGTDPKLYTDYVYIDGFQFGWSAGIKDSAWWRMFDMNYLRNYYQKYCDVSKVNGGLGKTYAWWMFQKKYPKVGNKGQDWFKYNQEILVFAILNTDYAGDWNDTAIENQIRQFLNKENGADKDTHIHITHRNGYDIRDIYNVCITNNRVAPISRPLYLEFIKRNA